MAETGGKGKPIDPAKLPERPERRPVQETVQMGGTEFLTLREAKGLVESIIQLQGRLWTQVFAHMAADAEMIRQLDERQTVLEAKIYAEAQRAQAVNESKP